MNIAEAVRFLRERLGKKQSDLAAMLGCRPNTVSRYELGSFPPGPLVLIRLLQIARAAELGSTAAADAFRRELAGLHARGLIGGGKTADETIATMLSVSAEVLKSSQRAEQLLGILPEPKLRDFGFRQFVPAVANVIEASDTVDQSISDILNLWAAHSQNEAAVQYFRDALGFLRGQLFQSRALAEREHAPRTDRHERSTPDETTASGDGVSDSG